MSQATEFLRSLPLPSWEIAERFHHHLLDGERCCHWIRCIFFRRGAARMGNSLMQPPFPVAASPTENLHLNRTPFTITLAGCWPPKASTIMGWRSCTAASSARSWLVRFSLGPCIINVSGTWSPTNFRWDSADPSYPFFCSRVFTMAGKPISLKTDPVLFTKRRTSGLP